MDIQGQLTLPQQLGGLVVDISGQNYIAVNADGVSLIGGATITLPGKQTFDALGLLEVETEDVSITIDTDQQEVKLQGTFTVPDLNNFQIDLSGDQFIGFELTDGGLAFAMNAQFSIATLPIWNGWSLQNVVVTAVKPYDGDGSAAGTASIQTPGSAIQVALAFADGRVQSVGFATAGGVQFNLLGTEVAISQFVFTPNIDPNSDGWDPQVAVQGTLTLPAALGNAVVSVTDPNELVVNASGISLTGGAIEIPPLDFNLLGLLEVKAQDLSIEYNSSPQMFKIQGTISLPSVYNATADFAGNNYIEVTPAGVDVVGQISVGNIVIVPNEWELKNAQLTIDTTKNLVQGQANLTIPTGIVLQAGLGFVGGSLNYISLGASNLNLAIGATGAFLQSIQGSVNHVAPGDPNPVQFQGAVGVTAGPQVSVSLPSWAGGGFSGSLVQLGVNGLIDAQHLAASGNITLVGGLATATGSVNLNWNTGVLSANANFNMLDNIISEAASFTVDSHADLTMSGTGTVRLPSIPWTPLKGQTLGSGNGYFQYVNGNPSADDYVMGWGVLNVPLLGAFTLGVRVAFDGTFNIISSEDQIAAYAPGGGTPPSVTRSLGGVAASQTFVVAPGTTRLLLTAEWENDVGSVPIEIQAPDGTIYTEADLANTSNMEVVDQFSDSTSTAVGVLNPEAGNWTIIIPDATGLGQVQFDATRDGTAPTIQLTSPAADVSGPSVSIGYNVASSNPGATISLFYSTESGSRAGVPIVEGLAAPDGAGSYVWDTSGLPTGDYYVYAMISDNTHPPSFANAPGQVSIVQTGALEQVQGVTAKQAGGGGIALSWSDVPGAAYYQVDYADQATGSAGWQTTITNGDVDQILIGDLVPGDDYQFQVAAVDPSGQLGTSSTPVTTTVNFPAPVLSSISPDRIEVGYSSPLTLEVDGSSFYPQSVIALDGTPLTTTYVSSTELMATISASDLASVGNDLVTVTNPTPGGATSTAATFQVLAHATSVYVNTAYASGALGTAETWSDGSVHYVGYDAFGTIQAGANAVAVGGTVNVAAGTYNEAVTVTEPLTLAAAGPGSDNPVLDGTGLNSSAAGIAVDASGVAISDLTVQNFGGPGIDVSGGTVSITSSTLSHEWRRHVQRWQPHGHRLHHRGQLGRQRWLGRWHLQRWYPDGHRLHHRR